MLLQSANSFVRNNELCLVYHDDYHIATPQFHFHDYYEITIMISGKMDCLFEDRTYTLTKGDILLIRPNDVHMKTAHLESTHINVAVIPSVVESALAYLTTEDPETVFNRLLPLLPQTLSQHEFTQLHTSLAMLSDDYVTQSVNIRTRLRSLVIDILSSYLIQSNTSSRYSAVPDWLNSYLQAFGSPENLVKGVGFFSDVPVSHGHLCRIFKKHLNMTINQYVNDSRLSYAANALLFSDVPILQICYEVGYSSLSHFYHLFREKYGVTPAAYRMQGVSNQADLFNTTFVTPISNGHASFTTFQPASAGKG